MIKGYFDNAATTMRKPNGMYEFVVDYMQNNGVNVSRGNYAMSKNAGALIKDTRKLMLDLVCAEKTKETVFLPSATIALNTIISGLSLSKNDVVYISPFEHNAVVRPLKKKQEEIGFSIKQIEVSAKDYSFCIDSITRQFEIDNPKVVVLSHVSNVIGLVAPVNEIASLAKKYGATIVVDGSQACGILDYKISSLIDYYVFAGHKTLMAPFGIAGFICDKNTSLPAMIYGGTGIDSANEKMPNTVPERFEAGSQNIMAIAGLYYSIRWLLEHKEDVYHKEAVNFQKLKEILSKYDFIKMVCPNENTISICSCYFEGYTSGEIDKVLSKRGIAIRSGLHCSPLAHKFIGSFPEGLVRFSVNCFTNEEDFVLLKEVFDSIEEEM